MLLSMLWCWKDAGSRLEDWTDQCRDLTRLIMQLDEI